MSHSYRSKSPEQTRTNHVRYASPGKTQSACVTRRHVSSERTRSSSATRRYASPGHIRSGSATRRYANPEQIRSGSVTRRYASPVKTRDLRVVGSSSIGCTQTVNRQWLEGQDVEAYNFNSETWNDARVRKRGNDGSVTVQLRDGKILKFLAQLLERSDPPIRVKNSRDTNLFNPTEGKKQGDVRAKEPVAQVKENVRFNESNVQFISNEPDAQLNETDVQFNEHDVLYNESAVQFIPEPVVLFPFPTRDGYVVPVPVVLGGVPVVFPDSAMEISEPAVEVDELAVEIDELAVELEEPAVELEEPAVEFDEPAVEVDEPAVEIDEPAVEVNELDVQVNEPGVLVNEPVPFWDVRQTQRLGPTLPDLGDDVLGLTENSITKAVASLTADDSKYSNGVCYAKSARDQNYYLIWRSDKVQHVKETFEIVDMPTDIANASNGVNVSGNGPE